MKSLSQLKSLPRIVCVISLCAWGAQAKAQVAVEGEPLPPQFSDALVDNGTGFQGFIPEVLPAGQNEFPLVTPGVFTVSQVSAGQVPITGAIVFAEDPNALPETTTPVFISTPHGSVQVSDVVFRLAAAGAAPQYALVSDLDPSLPFYASLLNSNPTLVTQVLPETGAYQDVGKYLGAPAGQILAASDVAAVPLPSAAYFMLSGLGGLGAMMRKRKVA